MTFNRCDKYKYSIIMVCESINGHLSGTADPLPVSQFVDYCAWLSWRIHEAWHEPSTQSRRYDGAVRELGLAALELAKAAKP